MTTSPRRPPRGTGVTQTELARLVGVSQTTVQRVLQGHPYIAEDKRRKVLEAMERLNYRPNSAARAMRQGRYGTMGMLVVSDTHYMPGELLLFASEALAEANERLAIIPVEQARLGDEAYLTEILRTAPVDGLLLHYPDRPVDALVATLSRFNIPTVWLNRPRGGDDVFFDDYDAARRVVEGLAGWGHQRIAYVEGDKTAGHRHEDHYSRADRRAGYRDAMMAAGLAACAIDAPASAASPGYSHDGREFFARIFDQADYPTAFICYSPADAGPILAAAARATLAVPEQVSVIAFGQRAGVVGDDGGLELGLSLLSLDYGAMGRFGARMLLDKVANPQHTMPTRKVNIPIWWRGTTGPCLTAANEEPARTAVALPEVV